MSDWTPADDQRLLELAEATERLRARDFAVVRERGSPAARGSVVRLATALSSLADSLQAEYRQLQRLDQIASRINQGLLLEEILERVYEAFRGVIPYERIGFSLLRDSGTTVTAHWARSEMPVVRLGRGYSAALAGSSLEEIIRSGQPRILNDLEGYLARKPQSRSTRLIVEEGLRSSLTCPLLANGVPVGFLFFSSQHSFAYAEVHVEVFQRIAAQLSMLLEKGRIVSELSESRRQLAARNQFIRHVFGRYLSDQVVESLLASPQGLRLGGERRLITMLVSDLRGFTPLAERLAPEQVLAVVNHLFEELIPIIVEHGGTIDELLGDSILALFGAPVLAADDAERAVACALRMQLAMAGVNQRNRVAGLPAVEMGIGLHTGEVVIGNIGSRQRTKYGVVGSAMNLAARIESFTIGGQVLVSQATLGAIAPAVGVEVAASMEVEPKGLARPLTVHEVVGIGGRHRLHLTDRGDNLSPLRPPVAVRFVVMAGKDARGLPQSGELTRLSAVAAELVASWQPRLLDDLRIDLCDEQGATVAEGLYAKVLAGQTETAGAFLIRFTAVPPAVETLIGRLLLKIEG